MPQINDAIDLAIANVGTANQLNDKLLRYYQANGATSNDLDDAEREFLLANGAGNTLGAEQIVDPTFTNTSFWTEGVGWTVANPGARIDGTNVALSVLSASGASVPFTGLNLVEMTIVNYIQGSIQLGAGAFRGETFNSNGVHQVYTELSITGVPLIEASIGAKMDVTKLSVRKVIGGNTQFHINDMWEYFLRVTKGYSGALDDMQYRYWTVGPRP